jgi:cellobiose phosphorylase
MLNPIHHAETPLDVDRYKVEPYVIAADVYSIAPHAGRGGWTWYTGSAAWMYRLGLEGILGLRRTASGLVIEPRIPPAWPGYEVEYRHGTAAYHIRVRNERRTADVGRASVSVDGQNIEGNVVELRDDGAEHRVEVILSD